MWWHRCDSLKCLLCLWKGLWTNECELLATPAYKRCICVRQRKGPASVMGDGASACGMWCLGERAGAEQMQSVYLANQTCWSPTDMFTQELNMQIHPFLSDRSLSSLFLSLSSLCFSFSVWNWLRFKKKKKWSVLKVFYLLVCLLAYSYFCLSVCAPPSPFSLCFSFSSL